MCNLFQSFPSHNTHPLCLYLIKSNPHREEGHHFEDVELQKPPEKNLNFGETVREPSGQNQ